MILSYIHRFCSLSILYIKTKFSRYPHTGKIALCCIAKMENDYIRFFVEYYRALHFDTIFIYDNNDPDGECFEDVIGDYISSGFVKIIDYRGKKQAQLMAYQNCYDTYNKQYDWIAFFDCDEFLTFAGGTADVHVFFSRKEFCHYHVMHINWKVYGDNDLLDNDGRNVVERFKDPVMPLDIKSPGNSVPENNHVKSIVRGGLAAVQWVSVHTPYCKFCHCCDPQGHPIDMNSPFNNFDYTIVYLRHYSTKTVGEWIKNKMKRGIPDRSEDNWRNILNLDFFFRFNKKTKEKIEYAEKLLKLNRNE